jgi:hypothetical protein
MYSIYCITTDPDTGDEDISFIGEIPDEGWARTILHLLSFNDPDPNRSYYSDPLIDWDMM